MFDQKTIYDVVGIGNAMIDVLGKVSDKFLSDRGFQKGRMTLVDAQTAGKIYADMDPEREVSGGSAANIVAGLASLGSDCAFIGKVYDDELGQTFRRDIGAAGIDFDTPPLKSGPSTGRSIVLVTPDAERSMFTYLGAATRLTPDDVDENIIKAAKYTFLEGYLWDSEGAKQALLKAADLAHKHGRKVAFTLSDTSCVLAHRKELLKFVDEHVDVLFANEDEIKAFFKEKDLMPALDKLKNLVEIGAITRNAQGSVVVNGPLKTFVEAEVVKDVVDTTGAGDLYAAGFMHGLVNGKTLGVCALMGGIVAGEIITHYGARPEVSLRGLIRKRLLQYTQNN
ncbi:MAG TPA: adenosine kinase [Alphaproteobacteria bacterium]|nr:adenosine kinase [Alphaproteobacteria bacterium]